MVDRIYSEIPRYLNKYWLRYRIFVRNTMMGNRIITNDGIAIWRDNFFTNFITWLVPVSLIILVPNVLSAFKNANLLVAIVHTLIAILIIVFSLIPAINLDFRKKVLTAVAYSFVFLLGYLGLFSSGGIYLLAITIFVTLIFPVKYAYFSVVINFLICIFGGAIAHFNLCPFPCKEIFTFPTWVSLTTNLVLLSLVSVLIISFTIKYLENIIVKHIGIKKLLQVEILERARKNLLLKESEEHYKSLFFGSPSPMFVIEKHTLRFLQINQAANKSYGYSNEEFERMTLDDIKFDEDMLGHFEVLQKRRKAKDELININRHRRKNGETFFVEAVFSTIPFNEKEAILVIAIDITEQMSYIKDIEAQNQNLHEIAYIQSHIVRAPLSNIIGLVDLICHCAEEKPSMEILSYLLHSANTLDEVIHAITDKTEQV